MNSMRQLLNLMEGVSAVPGFGSMNEGNHTQHYFDANKPSKVRQDAEIAKAEKEQKDAKEAEKAKKKVNESYTGDESIDTAIDEILSGASDNYMTMEDALVKVSSYLINAGYSNDEVLGIMDRLENHLHDESMRDDMEDGQHDSYDMSDDAEADHESEDEYWSDPGMDSPTDFDEYEMNADDSFDEGTSIDDLFSDDEEHKSLEEVDLNNGYDNVKKASGGDYFPSGAESSVTTNVGPSGAKQGDNPEQKRMQVAEVHKELVYGYRNYLKESSVAESDKFAETLDSLEKMTENILNRNGKKYEW